MATTSMSLSADGNYTKVGPAEKLEPSVVVHSDAVFLDNIAIESDELARHLATIGLVARPAEVIRFIKVGFAAAARADVASTLDMVEKETARLFARYEAELQRHSEEMRTSVAQSFDPKNENSYTAPIIDSVEEQAQSVATLLKQTSEELSQLVEQSFDPANAKSYVRRIMESFDVAHRRVLDAFDPARRDSFTSQLERRLEANFGPKGSLAEFIDRKLSLSDQNGPMAAIIRELGALKTAMQVRESLNAQSQDMLKLSSAKGVVFEEELDGALSRLAAAHGDTVERLTTKAGGGRCKRGDFVYDIPSLEARIVIEARDGEINSLPRLRREMKEALSNRTADAALTIVRNSEDLPEQVGRLAEYPEGIVTSFDNLEIALKVLRGRLAAERDAVDGVDVEQVSKGLSSVRAALRREAAVRRDVRAIAKAASNIESELRELRSEIEDGAETIEAALHAESE